MKLWHAPRPPAPCDHPANRRGDLPSYTRPLAAANDLTPYAILRALGQLRTGVGKTNTRV